MIIGYWLIIEVIGEQYSDKELLTNVEVRFTHKPGIRVSDYIIKRDSQQFLVAPNIPAELELAVELPEAGNYIAMVEAQYPHWLCEAKELDQATVRIQGGSLNETVNLIRHKPRELTFSGAKGQRVEFYVNNRFNKECGRAEITFYKENLPAMIQVGLALLWLCVFALCYVSRSSPFVVTLGLMSNLLLVIADASMGNLLTNGIIVNTGLAIIVTGVLFGVAAIPFRSRLIALISLLGMMIIVLPTLSFVAYEKVFSAPFSIEAVHGAMQSYSSQMADFWQQYIGKKRTLYFVTLLLLLYLGLRQINQALAQSFKATAFGFLLIIVGVALTLQRLHESRIYNLLLESVIVYQWEIDAFKAVASQRKTFSTQAKRDAQHLNDTTVIVFGESVNKKQMSAYGYVRPTTPRLDRRIAAGEVVRFTNAYSSHTHSNPTMSMMLTQANQYGTKRWQESPSIFNYARAADTETHWLTNHRLLGGWSNNITTIVREADRLRTINYMIGLGLESTYYDPDLLPLFRDTLRERPNQLTFLHLYNSHSFYCNRYPRDFKKFAGKLSALHYGNMLSLKRANDFMVNCYDNTIAYTDILLEDLISDLDQRDNPSALMYVADHAEEFLDGRTHNSAVFTFDMVNIPLIIWANEQWRQKHHRLWQNLKNNSGDVVTNDLMFESILGLAGIRAPTVDTSKDISNAGYSELQKPVTLYGRVALDQPSNWNFWQNKNRRYAEAQGVDLIAADIESLGEARMAFAIGIKHIRINVGVSEKGELLLLSKIGSDTIASVSEFLDSLSEVGFKSVSVRKISDDVDDTALQSALTQLRESTNTAVSLSDDKAEPLDLARTNFPQRLAPIIATNEKPSVAVTLSTRFTHPAPEPVELN